MYGRHTCSCSTKPSHFAKIQPQIYKTVLKIDHLWPVAEKQLHKMCKTLEFSTEECHSFLSAINFPSLVSHFPCFLLSWSITWVLLSPRNKRDKDQKRSLCPKGAQMLRSEDSFPKQGFSQKCTSHITAGRWNILNVVSCDLELLFVLILSHLP